MTRQRRTPRHLAVGEDLDRTACGMTIQAWGPMRAVTDPALVTCKRCRASSHVTLIRLLQAVQSHVDQGGA